MDVAYNFAVCLHGYVFEGRGLRHETAANGNQTLNKAHYSVVAFLGDDGDTEPTQEMLNGLRDAIEYFQSNGAGEEILGHRDGYATSCPGEPLYNWVRSGAPRPAAVHTGTGDAEVIVFEGSIPKIDPKVIPLPPLNTPMGLTQRWLSFASDFGDADLRIAVFNSIGKSWTVYPPFAVKANDGRVNFAIVDGDEKVSVTRGPNDKGGPVSYMVEAR